MLHLTNPHNFYRLGCRKKNSITTFFQIWIWSIQIDFIAIFRFERFHTIYKGSFRSIFITVGSPIRLHTVRAKYNTNFIILTVDSSCLVFISFLYWIFISMIDMDHVTWWNLNETFRLVTDTFDTSNCVIGWKRCDHTVLL